MVLTQSTTFYDLSVSRNLFYKAAMRKFGTSGTDGFNTLLNHKNFVDSNYSGPREHFVSRSAIPGGAAVRDARPRSGPAPLLIDFDSRAPAGGFSQVTLA